ncbi:MAG: Septum formation initiator [Clostridia bacterium 62_21]|nr:MAG: Septum formation initiator [Clostridia bacterium 62_21]HAG07026.1 septum formation initiator [Peptococcaceae bacterium]
MNRAKARRRFNLARSKLPYIFLALLLAYFAISVTTELGKLWYMQRNIADMEQSVRELRKKNEALWDKVKLLQSDAYVEKVAREKLGLVKPGETRVVPVPAAPEQGAPAPDPTIRD